MNEKYLVLLLLISSLFFNIIFVSIQMSTDEPEPEWIFPELGPAIIQDSAFGRSPALESPIGIIGDLPGAYPIYGGNPLQSENLTLPAQLVDESILLLILFLGVIPPLIVLVLGRRSYGSAKTQ